MRLLTFRGDVASAEHKALLDAALNRDADTAEFVLRTHINGGVAHSFQVFAK
jgi:DNA-binding GntR family transcriptional regulator